VFVPAVDGSGGEDDGYLATFVYDRNRDASAFCLFDATRLSAGPIASVQLPVRVPVGFHGVWVPDSVIG
jgi:carotenoid cleavage dioxygenase